MKLSRRLFAVAQYVPDGARVVDVGTDHAKLCIWLSVHRGARCIATDVNREPYEVAKRRISGLPGIQLRLGDGLECVEPDEADIIVIAGMGGETIADILKNAPWSQGKRCLLQPASRADRLRGFCYEHGYGISLETVVSDAGRWCPVLVTDPCSPMSLSADLCFASRALRENATQEVLDYTDKQIEWLSRTLSKQEAETVTARRTERRALAAYYTEALTGLKRWREGTAK